MAAKTVDFGNYEFRTSTFTSLSSPIANQASFRLLRFKVDSSTRS